MSRSNGPMVPPGGVPPRPPRLNQAAAQQAYAPPPPPAAPPATANEQLSQVSYRQPQRQPQGLGHGAGHTAGQGASQGFGHGGGQGTGQGTGQGFGQGYGQPSAQGPAQGYAPQFDTYVQPSQTLPPQPPAYGGHPSSGYAVPHGYEPAAPAPQQAFGHQAHYAPPAPAPVSRAPEPAFDAWAQQPATPDPRGYDLGGYSPAADPGYRADHAYAQPAMPHQLDPSGYPSLDPSPSMPAAGDWNAQGQYAPPHAHEPSFDPASYRGDGADYQQQHAAAQDQPGEYEDEDYETDEAPSRPWMKIAAALVGAVVVGGGLAFAYTQLMTGDSTKPPLMAAPQGPNGVKPADAGGKKFANTDSKLSGRLVDQPIAAGDADPAGVKKVSTVKIGPDGAIVPPPETAADSAPPASGAEAPAAVASASESADDGFPSIGATYGSPVPPPAASAEGPLTVAPPKTIDKVAEKATTKVAAASNDAMSAVSQTTTNSISSSGGAAAAVKPVQQAPAPVKKIIAAAPDTTVSATAPAPVKKTTTAAVAAPASTGAGYVAVLASVPVSSTSRINALKQFADMQQKYSSVLLNKAPEVKEANLGEKGTYHRLLVGPPGSREGAQALCGSLKQAGYGESCWVTAY